MEKKRDEVVFHARDSSMPLCQCEAKRALLFLVCDSSERCVGYAVRSQPQPGLYLSGHKAK